ncbi:MAG: diguanylate cyclase [Actinobacteria bacterium]|nr:diguanylate cyclase [Actinomycetota bacterium]MCA1720086.1 diguanylate cyclase [Actinomycetota bacterium]
MTARQLRSAHGSRTVLVSVALVLLLGAAGLLTGHHASVAAQRVHVEDRLTLQTTLGNLAGQYTQVAGGSLRDALKAQLLERRGRWPAAPGAPSAARLTDLMRAAPMFDVGTALVGPFGTTLAVSGRDLPAPTDPGWLPLRTSVLSGRQTLPVSGVLTAGAHPAAAIALPVDLNDGSRGLVVGIFRIDRGPLQDYVANLAYGKTGRGYVVDAVGLVIAAPTPAEVGRPLPGALWSQLSGRRERAGVLDRDGRFTSYAPAGTSGWTAVTVQDSSEFLGELVRSGRVAEGALVLLLLIAGTGLVLLNRKREGALQHVALRDELTGVYNRRGWFALAGHELERARRAGETRGLLFVDVDGLKVVNDVLGHREGDRAIAGAAEVLTRTCRGSDLVGRLGGDEFVLLLGDGGDPQHARERLYASLAGYNEESGAAFELRLSAGSETWRPADPCSVDELVRRADAVMYADKTSRPLRTTSLLRVPGPRDESAEPARCR